MHSSLPAFSTALLALLSLTLAACNLAIFSSQPPASFSLDYHVYKGLDCASVQDCGYRVEVAQTGEAIRYDDPGTGVFIESGRQTLTAEEMDALAKILQESGFFDFPPVLPEENPRIGGDLVTVTHVAWPAQTRTSVQLVRDAPLPEPAQALLEQLDAFFRF